MANPFAYEEYRKEKIRQKIEESTAQRVNIQVGHCSSSFHVESGGSRVAVRGTKQSPFTTVEVMLVHVCRRLLEDYLLLLMVQLHLDTVTRMCESVSMFMDTETAQGQQGAGSEADGGG